MKNVQLTLSLLASLCCCAMPAFGVVEFNDGGEHSITYEINEDVWVDHPCLTWPKDRGT